MFAERADAVITRIAGHDARKAAPQKQKWGNFNRSPAPMRNSGDAGASGSGGPEPMELGTASRRTLSRPEYEKLRAEKACFICQKPGHLARNCPDEEEKKAGKRDEQLTLTVGVNDMQFKDGESPAGPEKSGEKSYWLKLQLRETLVHTGVQVDEDSLPGLKTNESDLSA